MMTLEHLLKESHAVFNHSGELKAYTGLKTAKAFRADHYIDLLTQLNIPYSIEESISFLEARKINSSFKSNEVFVLNYELGVFFETEKINSEDILFYFFEFEKVSPFKLENDIRPIPEFTLEKEMSREDYFKMFDKAFQKLEDGDCYQINLTTPFKIKYTADFESIYAKFLGSDHLSEFAHAISIKECDLVLLSNSPECLFEVKGDILRARPIKGSISDKLSESVLINDKKNHTELMIITDLLRNDLSRIGDFFSEVISFKKTFRVPGILHQFSEIAVKLKEDESLYNILKAVFPGGSITGAPKKRVIKIIDDLEFWNRGVYTGSTVLLNESTFNASINIRTAKFDLNDSSFLYGAGGGITLLSDPEEEYLEMKLKVESFLKIFRKTKIVRL